MIRNSGSGKLPLLMLLPGAAALALRRGLYAAAVDAKGLLIQNHPLEIALLVLTAAALTYVAALVSSIFQILYYALIVYQKNNNFLDIFD